MIALLAGLLLAAPADVATQLASRYRAWDAAYLGQDAKALASLLHPRFRIVTGSGKTISRKDYLVGIGRGVKPEEYRTEVLRAERAGLRAFAWTRETALKGGERHVHRYRDAWALTGGHWLLLESRTLSEEWLAPTAPSGVHALRGAE